MINIARPILNRSATGTDTPNGYLVHGKGATITVRTTGNANGTLKFYMSLLDPTNFTEASSYTNPYTPVEIVSLDDHSTVSGSTGIILAGSDVVRSYDINTNGAVLFFCPIITAYTAGTFTVDISLIGSDFRS